MREMNVASGVSMERSAIIEECGDRRLLILRELSIGRNVVVEDCYGRGLLSIERNLSIEECQLANM